jgi:cobalt-zinc-cadmium efflux system membrane fusion protein
VQLQPVEVRAYVSEQYVSQLKIGGKAIVRPRVPLAEGQAVPVGRITGVIAEAVTRSRTFPVRIEVDNPDHFLKAGMLAEVELEVGPQRMSTMVPKDALYIDRRYPLPQVFLAVPDEKDPKKTKPLQLAVKQGASLGRWIVVEAVGGTIEPGDLVVEKGNERISPATKELIPITEGATPPPGEEMANPK